MSPKQPCTLCCWCPAFILLLGLLPRCFLFGTSFRMNLVFIAFNFSSSDEVVVCSAAPLLWGSRLKLRGRAFFYPCWSRTPGNRNLAFHQGRLARWAGSILAWNATFSFSCGPGQGNVHEREALLCSAFLRWSPRVPRQSCKQQGLPMAATQFLRSQARSSSWSSGRLAPTSWNSWGPSLREDG